MNNKFFVRTMCWILAALMMLGAFAAVLVYVL